MDIEFKKSKLHGNGVFAITNIQANEIIEICPIIILNENDTKQIDKTNLYNYYFSWTKNGSAISLGYGSIYNHSYEPNAKYEKDFSNKRLIFRSIEEIKKGEEIFVNYNGDPNNKEKVWFDKDGID
ncbi:SET domain-containing protein-lysine N-methyltransferase [Patescibacteria group bacterium]|nr:SET domain-containing protein-lysine N-methyltransferase [Patescibacteria group bacterium]